MLQKQNSAEIPAMLGIWLAKWNVQVCHSWQSHSGESDPKFPIKYTHKHTHTQHTFEFEFAAYLIAHSTGKYKL